VEDTHVWHLYGSLGRMRLTWLITCGDVALGMRDRRNWSCGASVVIVVVASRRGSRGSCLSSGLG
jgi:hypothetical protein